MCNCEWQPIETAPKDGSDILVYLPHSSNTWITSTRWVRSSDQPKGFWDFGLSDTKPLYWMPLPPAPKIRVE